MLLLTLAVSVSAQWLVGIKVDGYPVTGFISSKRQYQVQVPLDKKFAKVEYTTASPEANVMMTPYNGIIALKDTTTEVKISVEGGAPYILSIVRSPYAQGVYTRSQIGAGRPVKNAAPQINCPRIFSASVGVPFFFNVAASGERPIKFEANLPAGLSIDGEGIITGTTPSNKGEIKVDITATNSAGTDKITLSILVGGKPQATPPMGWNSWYVQSDAISDDGIREITEAIVSNGLPNYGWTYVNIDDCWQGFRSDQAPYKISGKKPFSIDDKKYGGFPDMAALTKYVHSKGLRIGIYMSPHVMSYQGFFGSSSYNISGMDYDLFSPKDGNTNEPGPKFDDQGHGTGNDGNPGVGQPSEVFGYLWPGFQKSKTWTIGEYWLGDVDIQQFADWGFDYVKWDWALFNDWNLTTNLVDKIHGAIVKSGRDIVLSLSNSVKVVELGALVSEHGANLARTCGDINDHWNIMSSNAKNSLDFVTLAGHGFWPDPDMLQIGMIGVPGGLNVDFHPTNLKKPEQYFQMSMWSILPAPLLLSCDLRQLDDFTLTLLENREINLVNQDSLGLPSVQINGREALVKLLDDGSVAVGFFNWDDAGKDITVKFADVTTATSVAFPNGANVRDLWLQQDVGLFKDEFAAKMDFHDGKIFKFTPA